MGYTDRRFQPRRALRAIGANCDERLENLAHLAAVIVGAEGGYLALEGSEGWRVVARSGLPKREAAREFNVTVAKDGYPAAANADEHAALWPVIGAFDDIILTPIVMRGEIVGHLGTVMLARKAFTAHHKEALRLLACTAGDYLETQARIRELLGGLWNL